MFRGEDRRHQVRLSDEGLEVTLRALKAYTDVLKATAVIPGAVPPMREANWATHAHAALQEHLTCTCTPEGGSE